MTQGQYTGMRCSHLLARYISFVEFGQKPTWEKDTEGFKGVTMSQTTTWPNKESGINLLI